jgi:23S rRNA (pseudouridine1915-N3)-methyltransferase
LAAGLRLRVVSVGRDKEHTAAGAEEYRSRLAKSCQLELVELRAESGPAAAEREGQHILEAFARGKGPGELWALDLTGQQLSSPELAAKVGRLRDASQSLTLAIGGDEGLSPRVLAASRFKWCLSRLTLPHRLARLLVLEQLYRAFEILRGSPYHK